MKATSLKAALKNGSEVLELALDEAGLSALPPEITKLTALRKLSLRGNALRALPSSLAALAKLEELDIVANDITKVDKALAGLRLKKLSLSGSFKKKTFAAGLDVLFQLESLEELEIQSIAALVLPASLAKHPRLARLSFFVCGFEEFPRLVSTLPKLETLSFASSNVGKLPSKLGGLKALRSLDLSSTNIRKLPRAFCDLPLTSLAIGENEEIELDDDLTRLSKLKKLRFNNVYKPLSPVLGKLQSLEHLVISNNSCRTRVAPAWLANLVNLRVLDVSNNVGLEEIPVEVLALPKLETLICFNSPLAKGKHAKRVREVAPHLVLA